MQLQIANGEGVRRIPARARPRGAQFTNSFVDVSRRPVWSSWPSIPLAFTFLQFLLLRVFDH